MSFPAPRLPPQQLRQRRWNARQTLLSARDETCEDAHMHSEKGCVKNTLQSQSASRPPHPSHPRAARTWYDRRMVCPVHPLWKPLGAKIRNMRRKGSAPGCNSVSIILSSFGERTLDTPLRHVPHLLALRPHARNIHHSPSPWGHGAGGGKQASRSLWRGGTDEAETPNPQTGV